MVWDLAYLKVPWPSCWCAWRIPGDVAALVLSAYRARTGWAVADVDIALAAAPSRIGAPRR